MNNKNFLVEYVAKDVSGKILKSGKMKVKNKMSSFDAQVKLEFHLKKKHPNMETMEVLMCK